MNRGQLSRPDPRTRPTDAVLANLSTGCPPPMGRLPTCYSPVRHFTRKPKPPFSCDLHVLGPPLTFALIQDQTLHLKSGTFAPASCCPRRDRAKSGLYLSLALEPTLAER